jgi:hypothetical protein
MIRFFWTGESELNEVDDDSSSNSNNNSNSSSSSMSGSSDSSSSCSSRSSKNNDPEAYWKYGKWRENLRYQLQIDVALRAAALDVVFCNSNS